MNALKRLHVRLGLAMAALFALLAGALIWISAQTSNLYSLETTQRINRDIALHAAEDMPLLDENGVNEAALKELAHHVMFINPIVEVYLLDPQGQVLSHALPYGTVLRDRVDMQPLRQFLENEHKLPIFGDDPRSLTERKTFSVSPIVDSNGTTQAYLYTVLNGKTWDGIRRSLAESYNLRTGVYAILLATVAALAGGLGLFLWLTRRLRRLSAAVQSYRKGSFEQPLALPPSDKGDELDELGGAMLEMSERIDRQFNAQREIDRNRRELIANVSHDLRTPVCSIQGYLETVLVKDLPPATEREYLNTAHRQCIRLNELIGELFELSTLESGTVEPQWERFAVMELVQDIIHDHERMAADRQITLRAQCSTPQIEVYADIAMIHRVLDNLINNALRHTGVGGEIVLRVTDDRDRVRVEVIDNGEGIAARDIPHIFDRFYRNEVGADADGHGLGLAIVKCIVDLHRSSISVRSAPQQGTEFSFWLPQQA